MTTPTPAENCQGLSPDSDRITKQLLLRSRGTMTFEQLDAAREVTDATIRDKGSSYRAVLDAWKQVDWLVPYASEAEKGLLLAPSLTGGATSQLTEKPLEGDCR